ncbi:Uncharacterized protein TCM_000936 [Theobroma cacao]|uniref:RRM domain-containing protein n=1 Tax=Theobroma cacao TaxID=3641 RepID=A0A061DIY6_THECC|nr:Uncharacterized protein TCM_000936 [Theobroma cacao]
MNNFLSNQFHPLAPPNHLPTPPPNWPHNGGVTQIFRYPPIQPAPLHIPQPRISTTTQKPFQRDLSNNWRSSIHSIFVTNLSRRVTTQGLKDFFDVYGRVRDVFISLKQNPNKTTTFAFVRYKETWEMERAILQNNGRKLDGYHLMEEFEWLNRSAVGTLSTYVHHEILQGIFAEEGYQCIVKPMGGKNVLLTFCMMEDFKACTSEYRAWLNLWFESVVPWKDAQPTSDKMIWLRIEGVPINLWTECLFREIGEQWGSYVFTNDDTAHRRRYDAAHIKEFPKPRPIGDSPATSPRQEHLQLSRNSDSNSNGRDMTAYQNLGREPCKVQNGHSSLMSSSSRLSSPTLIWAQIDNSHNSLRSPTTSPQPSGRMHLNPTTRQTQTMKPTDSTPQHPKFDLATKKLQQMDPSNKTIQEAQVKIHPNKSNSPNPNPKGKDKEKATPTRKSDCIAVRNKKTLLNSSQPPSCEMEAPSSDSDFTPLAQLKAKIKARKSKEEKAIFQSKKSRKLKKVTNVDKKQNRKRSLTKRGLKIRKRPEKSKVVIQDNRISSFDSPSSSNESTKRRNSLTLKEARTTMEISSLLGLLF